jgi:hypothetical protein
MTSKNDYASVIIIEDEDDNPITIKQQELIEETLALTSFKPFPKVEKLEILKQIEFNEEEPQCPSCQFIKYLKGKTILNALSNCKVCNETISSTSLQCCKLCAFNNKLCEYCGDEINKSSEEYRMKFHQIIQEMEELDDYYIKNAEYVYNKLKDDEVFGDMLYDNLKNSIQNKEVNHLDNQYLLKAVDIYFTTH